MASSSINQPVLNSDIYDQMRARSKAKALEDAQTNLKVVDGALYLAELQVKSLKEARGKLITQIAELS